jgi:hypothetical protein
MSIPVLIQVYEETRRLAIAGSAVAPGDFRLKKLIPPLEKSGEKAPIFVKVAQSVQAVVDSDDKTASTALLDLTTLVNAILHTQGETGAAGEFKPLETTDLGAHSTQAGARLLKPLLEALSSTGSGRMELVRDAFERGAFQDLRLVQPALRAIDDPYPEIADLIVGKVLPLYGKAVLPMLRSTLEIKGRGGHLHRLQLMHRLDPQGCRDLVELALNEGSKEMKVAAVECLGTADADLAYLLDQARAKAKDVRAAALRALAAAGSSAAEVVAALIRAIDSPDLELIAPQLGDSPLPEVRSYVLEQAERQLAELLKSKDKKLAGDAVTRLQQLVLSLSRRTDDGAEAFLIRCFDGAPALAAIKSEPSGTDLNEFVAHVLSQGTPRMQKRLVSAHKGLSGGMLSSAVYAARATLTPADFYAEFSPLLKGASEKLTKKNTAEHERGMALLGVLNTRDQQRPYFNRHWTSASRHQRQRRTIHLPALDPRWLDAAVEAGTVGLVCALARPGHEAANRFLSNQLAHPTKPHESQEVLRTMVRIKHPDATDALIAALQKQATDTHFHYFSYWYGPMIADLPGSALPKLEALLPSLPDKMVDQLMEPVLALKHKSE